jgi:hypothetical protein
MQLAKADPIANTTPNTPKALMVLRNEAPPLDTEKKPFL